MPTREGAQGGRVVRRKTQLLHGVTARRRFSRGGGAAGPDGRGRVEAFQLLAPELPGGRLVPTAQPLDEITVRARGGEPRLASLAQRAVKLKDLFEQEQARAAVEQRVVRSPDEPVVGLRHPEEREAHEWCLLRLEAAPPILLDVFVQTPLLLFRAEAAPVVSLKGNLDPFVNELERAFDPVPAEARAQDGVALRGALPCGDEGRDVQDLMQAAAQLLDVDAGVPCEQGVEQHALLHRRKLV